jgi:hypothetical protein
VKKVKSTRDSLKRISEIYGGAQAMLLGGTTTSGECWQYIRELCFAHPPAAFCVCTHPNSFLPYSWVDNRDADLLVQMLNRTMVPVLTPSGRPFFETLGVL